MKTAWFRPIRNFAVLSFTWASCTIVMGLLFKLMFRLFMLGWHAV